MLFPENLNMRRSSGIKQTTLKKLVQHYVLERWAPGFDTAHYICSINSCIRCKDGQHTRVAIQMLMRNLASREEAD